ncbi:MAG TPA: enoyl-CoA hydratase/isomerase family protein [Methylomirabilota bacterium]|nr:enoyl-CoA hydratase/isomerase family protein [Methylomirabilota bacterium]
MIDVIEHGPVRELRLARPPVNALSPELLLALTSAIKAAPVEGARALVLSGREGMFTGGLDVPLLLELDRDGLVHALEVFFDAMEALAASELPVAAAITGHSPAGGAVLALFCDWRVMAEGPFVIGLNEVRIGIPMPRVVCSALARAVGPRRAEELVQTGRLLSPDEALETGLVDRVVPPAGVVEAALAWCRELAELPRHALGASRSTVRRDLVEIVASCRARDVEVLAEDWFRPEVQTPLRRLVEQLRKR